MGGLMRHLTILSFALIVLFSLQHVQARICQIPADSSTIQACVNGAVNSDTVLVADGTYTGDGNRNIDFGGKLIVVMSENGPEFTTIDCEGNGGEFHRGFRFQNGEDSTAKVEGFTITDGHITGYGGAILCVESSSPTIRNCIITDNNAYGGGGICCDQSSPTISYCTIVSNAAVCYWSDSGSHKITGKTTDGKRTPDGCGGGILCMNSSNPVISNCYIGANVASFSMAQGSGAGISCLGSSPIITDCTIESNGWSSFINLGGGISCWEYSSPTITNCAIRYNYAGKGGGIACQSSSPEINYCAITGNTVYAGGGGIDCWDSSLLTIVNCTITRNTAPNGGGIFCYDCDPYTLIKHTILWNDDPDEIYLYSGVPPVLAVTYSDIEGGWPGIGNIDCDPLFCYPDTDNYYLAENSCCVGAGQGGVDIGAFGVRCDAIYTCGDANGDLSVDIADVIYLINYLFIEGPLPECEPITACADVNLDGEVDIADVMYLINYLFISGPEPCNP